MGQMSNKMKEYKRQDKHPFVIGELEVLRAGVETDVEVF
jgi:hypothetical protein